MRPQSSCQKKKPEGALYSLRTSLVDNRTPTGPLFIQRLHGREEQNITDRNTIGQQHNQPIDTDADAACRRHTVFKRGEEVLIHIGRFLIPGCFQRRLMLKPRTLVNRVIQFAEPVGVLAAQNEQLEPLGILRVIRFALGERGDVNRMLGDKDRLNQVFLAVFLKEEAENIARIVGLGSLKYFILKVDPRKNMTFNPKESIDFNGNTGPFIQYTYARNRSVLRKAAEQGIALPEQLPLTFAISEKEENLIQMIADYAEIVKEAGKLYSPACVANYIYDLVKEYNQFYHDFSILREENEAVKVFRIALSANVAKVVRLGMNLLGIEVPSRM